MVNDLGRDGYDNGDGDCELKYYSAPVFVFVYTHNGSIFCS